jgi:HEAT repeat protein
MDVAMDAVLAGIEHENPRVRAACAQLMDHGGDDRCIEPLRKALSDPVPKVRLRALHSLQCQRCKDEPLAYDVIPDMIRMAETDPDPKVRKGAIGGMGIQPPNRALLLALERVLEGEPRLEKSVGLSKLLRHHMHACSLDELLERIEGKSRDVVRQAAALNLDRHPASAEIAGRIEQVIEQTVETESNEILRRCLERGRRHHASLG